VESDTVDPSVGISDILPMGAWVEKGQPLARVHAARTDGADRAVAEVQAAVTLSDTRPEVPRLIRDRIGP
jgi:thymidine phosphorylase